MAATYMLLVSGVLNAGASCFWSTSGAANNLVKAVLAIAGLASMAFAIARLGWLS